MKSVLVLCLLTVLCTADATLLNTLLIKVRNEKWTVESIIQQLERIRNNVEQDVNLTIMKKWLQQMEKYDGYANSVLDTIRKEVEDAKAKGKNAQVCYDSALYIFKNIECEATTDARRCQEYAKISISNNLNFINDLITTGRELIEELDNIFPDCYEQNSRLIDILKLRSCITNQLGISKVSVKNLKADASSVKSTAKSASSIVVQQGTDCLNNAYSTAHSKVTEAKSITTRCINNV